MVDIHSHVLPLVDDGSSSLESSLKMVSALYAEGVTDLILTPHYRKEYKPNTEELKNAFSEFCLRVYEACVPINLYLGQEVYIDKNYKTIIASGKVLTVNGTDKVLIEFSYDGQTDMAEVVYDLKKSGYVPIVAHVERYSGVTVACVKEIKEIGGLIQVNASSLFSLTKKKMVLELIRNGLVDFIASDMHNKRKPLLKKAHSLIKKKFGETVASKLFCENALTIIKG